MHTIVGGDPTDVWPLAWQKTPTLEPYAVTDAPSSFIRETLRGFATGISKTESGAKQIVDSQLKRQKAYKND